MHLIKDYEGIPPVTSIEFVPVDLSRGNDHIGIALDLSIAG
jgi:hypothetical protein